MRPGLELELGLRLRLKLELGFKLMLELELELGLRLELKLELGFKLRLELELELGLRLRLVRQKPSSSKQGKQIKKKVAAPEILIRLFSACLINEQRFSGDRGCDLISEASCAHLCFMTLEAWI